MTGVYKNNFRKSDLTNGLESFHRPDRKLRFCGYDGDSGSMMFNIEMSQTSMDHLRDQKDLIQLVLMGVT